MAHTKLPTRTSADRNWASDINTLIDDTCDQVIECIVSGNAYVGASVSYFDAPFNLTLKTIRVKLGTAPTGCNLEIDILKNGTTILNSNLIVLDGETTGSVSSFAVATASKSDRIRFDYKVIGSTVVGADATIMFDVTRETD